MNNEFEEKNHRFGFGHFGRYSRTLLDPENTLKEIGLETGETFLDAGCGEGRFSISASEIVGNNGKVYAIDISEEAINSLKEEINKNYIKNIEAFTGDITKRLSIGDERIDVCLISNILHELVVNNVVNNNVESGLKEIFRVLKSDSILGVVEFKKIGGSPGPPLSIRMSPEEVEEIISKYGFKKERVIEVGKYHYAITFVKKIR